MTGLSWRNYNHYHYPREISLIKTLLNIQHWKTKNDVKVYFVQRRELPMVDIEVIFTAGSAYDENKYGVSQLTNCLLNQGTKNFNADELANKFEDLGVEFNVTSDRDLAKIGLRSLKDSKYLQPALQIISEEILNSPNFNGNAFLRMQKLVLSAIEHQKQVPEAVAKNAFYTHVYHDHPYSHSVLGTTESVQRLTIEDVRDFFNKYYLSQNATINIVGCIDRKGAESIAEKLVQNLRSGKAAGDILPATMANKMIEKIYFPSEQTHILIGQVGIRYDHPDYLPILIGNDILGGSALTSRLFHIVREKNGLAYSVFSALSSMNAGGQFVIILQTRKSETTQALKITHKVLDEFIKKGPTQKELLGIKNKIINGFPLVYAQNYDILQILGKISSFRLPLNYLDGYCDRINAVTIKQIRDAFAQHFPINKMVTLMIGDDAKSRLLRSI